MEKLFLRVFPDPVLREETKPVTRFDGSLKDIVAEMARLMNQHDGVGLAAPQAGVPLKLAIVFFGGVLYVLANPKLLNFDGEQEGEEGCLSFPGIFGNVKRPMKIRVRHQDISGGEHEIEAEGFLARAFLHEMDHLDGVLFVDRMSAIKKISLAGTLRRMKREMEERLGLGACPKGKF